MGSSQALCSSLGGFCFAALPFPGTAPSPGNSRVPVWHSVLTVPPHGASHQTGGPELGRQSGGQEVGLVTALCPQAGISKGCPPRAGEAGGKRNKSLVTWGP